MRVAPLLVYASVLLLTFGYEIFSFHLTIDEEIAGPQDAPGYALAWVGQGRWAMGVLTLMLPNPVVPVVSAGLGVVLSGAAWWLVCRRFLRLDTWASVASASLAATVPIFAYLYSFSTIAYGIGVGALLAYLFAAGIQNSTWRIRLGGIAAGTAAIGIYDTFLAVLAAFAAAIVLRRPTMKSAFTAIASVGVALLVSKALGQLASRIFDRPQTGYVGGLFDIQGLIDDPQGRLNVATTQVWQVISLQSDRVGLHSPFLSLTVIALVVLSLVAVVATQHGWKPRLLSLITTLLLIAIPYGAQAVSSVAVPLRSMIYIPAVVLVLAWSTARLLRVAPPSGARVARAVLGGLIILTVLGDAAISNRMFAASATSYARDQMVAFDIQQQIEIQTKDESFSDLAVVASGDHAWLSSVVTPTRETLGASFFAWDGGSAARMAAFLQSQGVIVHGGSVEDQQAAAATLDRMPRYPAQGWVRVLDGRLLLKFGPRTPAQS